MKIIRKGFENYELVATKDIVTFGTSVYIRKDKKALRIVFPSGQVMTFCPVEAEPESGDKPPLYTK